MERTVRKPRNIAMTLASVLLCLVLGSSYLVAGMFAKYATQDSDADSSRVAKFVFNVSDVGASRIIDLRGIEKPGDSEVYSFSVNSASEVSVKYNLAVTLNGSMPLTATINDGQADVLSVTMPGDDDGETVVEDGGVFAPNTTDSHNYTLTVVWPEDKNDLEYASAGSCAELKLVVSGIQVD